MDTATQFWSHVDRSGGFFACWPWLQSRNPLGYGYSGHGMAHRRAWTLTNGPIPPGGVIIRHSCDNPPCCNPSHLLLGTHADNVADKMARGRQAKGEVNGRAVLTAVDVPVIRARAADGESLAALAREYGVTRRAIQYIVQRINWRHVA